MARIHLVRFIVATAANEILELLAKPHRVQFLANKAVLRVLPVLFWLMMHRTASPVIELSTALDAVGHAKITGEMRVGQGVFECLPLAMERIAAVECVGEPEKGMCHGSGPCLTLSMMARYDLK